MKLDTAAREVKLSTKETVGYGQALVATGANVRRLRLEGGALEGIHYLRALGNADAIRKDAEGAGHVVLVGGSFVACEVAATLTTMGTRCTLVMEERTPLSRAFGDTAGAFFAQLLEAHGIGLVCADPAEAFQGAERVERVVCRSGRVLEADAVVMGTGAVPDVMLARGAGLELGETGGVACDDRLRTSAEGVWAAGDVCEYDSVLHGRRVRVEHWEVARSQGRAVAAAMLGADVPYTEVPYFWCDLADWAKLESLGPVVMPDRELLRGAPGDGAFSVLYLAGDCVVGALAVGRPEDLDGARALVAARAAVGGREAQLADPSVELASLV
jgi:3-phenylpropionate/trans-cinnamate dioxygenase ferredoxin reductase subunit